LRRDQKPLGDLLGHKALGDQPEHLVFAGADVLGAEFGRFKVHQVAELRGRGIGQLWGLEAAVRHLPLFAESFEQVPRDRRRDRRFAARRGLDRLHQFFGGAALQEVAIGARLDRMDHARLVAEH